MNHPAELKLHQFMSDAIDGKTTFSEETAKRIGEEVAEAVIRQFGSGQSRKEFRLRMSNIGRPTCQLWFEKNDEFFTSTEMAFFARVGVGSSFFNTLHLMLNWTFLSLRDQICLLSSVVFRLLALLKVVLWFLYLVLNSPSVKPT